MKKDATIMFKCVVNERIEPEEMADGEGDRAEKERSKEQNI